tara:strand:- start:700 stop:939 length:240 start_codon:yes stop_codon:yes gene_type:complete
MDFANYYITFHDPIWVLLLSSVLFFPVKKLIWVLYVRKKQKMQKTVSEDEKKILKKRATFTAILLCIVFSYIYVKQVFN